MNQERIETALKNLLGLVEATRLLPKESDQLRDDIKVLAQASKQLESKQE